MVASLPSRSYHRLTQLASTPRYALGYNRSTFLVELQEDILEWESNRSWHTFSTSTTPGSASARGETYTTAKPSASTTASKYLGKVRQHTLLPHPIPSHPTPLFFPFHPQNPISPSLKPPNLTPSIYLGGLDPITEVFPSSITEEIDQAFSNVDLALRTAGGKGWSQVYKVRTYVVIGGDVTWGGVLSYVTEVLRKWCPEHAPLLTGVAVPSLAFEQMRVEVEVVAHLG